ncbi:MAG: YjfB family protein [Betaproteobacteria bacterium]|nr:YjfB family protein [Betaproteobacteria bacterium]MCL2886887.1 YjfB family protein [Betaproteobacteria bacterium]
MNVGSIGGSVSSVSSTLSQARTGDAVGILVLKKAIDIQAQSALQLLQALPAVASNPSHLGSSVDVRV